MMFQFLMLHLIPQMSTINVGNQVLLVPYQQAVSKIMLIQHLETVYVMRLHFTWKMELMMELKVLINNVFLIVMLMIILLLAMIVGQLRLLPMIITQTKKLLFQCSVKRVQQAANVFVRQLVLTELMDMEDVSLLAIRENNKMMGLEALINVGLLQM